MQIDLEAVRDGVVVDSRGQSAGARQRIAVQTGFLGHGAQLIGRFARMLAASAANVDAQLVRSGIEAALQRADDGSRDAGRMPVHAHHRTEGLKPERIAQAREQLGRTVVEKNAFADRRAEARHAIGQPGRDTAAMQRKIGVAGASHLKPLSNRCACVGCSQCRHGAFTDQLDGRANFLGTYRQD